MSSVFWGHPSCPQAELEGWEDPVGSSGGDSWPQDLGVRVGNVWGKEQACKEEASCLCGEGLRPAGVLAFPASSLSEPQPVPFLNRLYPGRVLTGDLMQHSAITNEVLRVYF